MNIIHKISSPKLNLLGNQFKCKLMILPTLYVLLVVIVYYQISTNVQNDSNFSELSYEKFPIMFKLKNLQKDENILTNKGFNKIFFIETHLDSVRKLESARQACSVESAGES